MGSWRFLQCIRRYKDTRNIFPHLVNGGKYTASILSGVFLSVYRINGTNQNLGLFIAFSTVNGFYTGTYQLNMLTEPDNNLSHPLPKPLRATSPPESC